MQVYDLWKQAQQKACEIQKLRLELARVYPDLAAQHATPDQLVELFFRCSQVGAAPDSGARPCTGDDSILESLIAEDPRRYVKAMFDEYRSAVQDLRGLLQKEVVVS